MPNVINQCPMCSVESDQLSRHMLLQHIDANQRPNISALAVISNYISIRRMRGHRPLTGCRLLLLETQGRDSYIALLSTTGETMVSYVLPHITPVEDVRDDEDVAIEVLQQPPAEPDDDDVIPPLLRRISHRQHRVQPRDASLPIDVVPNVVVTDPLPVPLPDPLGFVSIPWIVHPKVLALIAKLCVLEEPPSNHQLRLMNGFIAVNIVLRYGHRRLPATNFTLDEYITCRASECFYVCNVKCKSSTAVYSFGDITDLFLLSLDRYHKHYRPAFANSQTIVYNFLISSNGGSIKDDSILAELLHYEANTGLPFESPKMLRILWVPVSNIYKNTALTPADIHTLNNAMNHSSRMAKEQYAIPTLGSMIRQQTLFRNILDEHLNNA